MATTHESGAETMRCYRHPDRETLLSCSNCERPICTSCMTAAAVGNRCPECAHGKGLKATPMARKVRARATSDTAFATTAIIAVTVLVYLAQAVQAGDIWDPRNAELVFDGAVFGPAIADGEWWRMITGGFLHASPIHLGFNMYLLWILGGALEAYVGPLRMLAIYFAAVLWGSVGALLLSPDSLTLGASGGVFGLMAAIYLLERQRGVALLGTTVGPLLLINLVITFVLPGISVGGHIGGILGGAAAGFILSGFGKGHLAYGRLGTQGLLAVGALIVGAVAVGVLIA
jgi:membrane associated rhomboid family serine protease